MWKSFVDSRRKEKIVRLIKTAWLKINTLGDNTAIFLDIIQVQRHVVTDFLIIHGLFFDNLRIVFFAVARKKSARNPYFVGRLILSRVRSICKIIQGQNNHNLFPVQFSCVSQKYIFNADCMQRDMFELFLLSMFWRILHVIILSLSTKIRSKNVSSLWGPK